MPGLKTLATNKNVTQPVTANVLKKKIPSIVKPVSVAETPLAMNNRLKSASDTTRAVRMTKMKARDPNGMLDYDRTTRVGSPTSLGLRDASYNRSLHSPVA